MITLKNLQNEQEVFRPQIESGDRIVEACCRELDQRGFEFIPKCLVYDLATAALDPFESIPPIEYPPEEGFYWEGLDHFFQSPEWHRCLDLISLSRSGRRHNGVGVLLLGVLTHPGIFENCREKLHREAKREAVNVPKLQVSSLTEQMVAASVGPSSDHRVLDLVAISIYEAGMGFNIAQDSVLYARLKELYQLFRGCHLGEKATSKGGIYGITRHSKDLSNILPNEMADDDPFYAKLANDEILYFKRQDRTQEDPMVLFSLFLDIKRLRGRAGVQGHSLESWAKTLVLWSCHDLMKYIVRHSQGIKYQVELSSDGGDISVSDFTVRFDLNELLLEQMEQGEKDELSLRHMNDLLPLFLRSTLSTQNDAANEERKGGDLDLELSWLNDTAEWTRPGGSIFHADRTTKTMPIFTFSISFSGESERDEVVFGTRSANPLHQASISLGRETCSLESRRMMAPVKIPCEINRIFELRRNLLEMVVDLLIKHLRNW